MPAKETQMHIWPQTDTHPHKLTQRDLASPVLGNYRRWSKDTPERS